MKVKVRYIKNDRVQKELQSLAEKLRCLGYDVEIEEVSYPMGFDIVVERSGERDHVLAGELLSYFGCFERGGADHYMYGDIYYYHSCLGAKYVVEEYWSETPTDNITLPPATVIKVLL